MASLCLFTYLGFQAICEGSRDQKQSSRTVAASFLSRSTQVEALLYGISFFRFAHGSPADQRVLHLSIDSYRILHGTESLKDPAHRGTKYRLQILIAPLSVCYRLLDHHLVVRRPPAVSHETLLLRLIWPAKKPVTYTTPLAPGGRRCSVFFPHP